MAVGPDQSPSSCGGTRPWPEAEGRNRLMTFACERRDNPSGQRLSPGEINEQRWPRQSVGKATMSGGSTEYPPPYGVRCTYRLAVLACDLHIVKQKEARHYLCAENTVVTVSQSWPETERTGASERRQVRYGVVPAEKKKGGGCIDGGWGSYQNYVLVLVPLCKR